MTGKQDKGEYVLAQTMNTELGKKANASHTLSPSKSTSLNQNVIALSNTLLSILPPNHSSNNLA